MRHVAVSEVHVLDLEPDVWCDRCMDWCALRVPWVIVDRSTLVPWLRGAYGRCDRCGGDWPEKLPL